MTYREKYKQHYGIKFGKEYEVHHLDFNHKNDDIENLVLLPAGLHRKFHQSLEPFGPIALTGGKIQLNAHIVSSDYSCGIGCCSYDDIIFFLATYKECQRWMDYKLFLDGELPNIHGIVLWGAA